MQSPSQRAAPGSRGSPTTIEPAALARHTPDPPEPRPPPDPPSCDPLRPARAPGGARDVALRFDIGASVNGIDLPHAIPRPGAPLADPSPGEETQEIGVVTRQIIPQVAEGGGRRPFPKRQPYDLVAAWGLRHGIPGSLGVVTKISRARNLAPVPQSRRRGGRLRWIAADASFAAARDAARDHDLFDDLRKRGRDPLRELLQLSRASRRHAPNL